MNDRDDLVALGFAVDGNGTLWVRNVSVSLTPEGQFYRLAITLPHGRVVSCHVVRNALKLTPPTAVDVETLIVGTPRRRPW
jgi:hypothetical protein